MRQATQWFGADCSLQHCPSNDDPRTSAVNEIDCTYMDNNGATCRGPTVTSGSTSTCYQYTQADSSALKLAANTVPAGAVSTVPGATVQYPGSGSPAYGINAGASGNLCHVDCSNRGVCDYSKGTCTCFKGARQEGGGLPHLVSVPLLGTSKCNTHSPQSFPSTYHFRLLRLRL